METGLFYAILLLLTSFVVAIAVSCRNLRISAEHIRLELDRIGLEIKQLDLQINTIREKGGKNGDNSEEIRSLQGRMKAVEMEWDACYEKFRKQTSRAVALQQQQDRRDGEEGGKGSVLKPLEEVFKGATQVGGEGAQKTEGVSLREQRDQLTAKLRGK